MDSLDIDSPEEMLRPERTNEFFFYILITNSITFVIGVLGNVFAVTVMIADKKGRNATNLFLVSLAVADLLLLLLCVPLETLQYFLVQWNERGEICKITKFIELLSATASVLNLCAVSLERFIVIVFPMRSRSLCTIRNCRKSILMVWIASIVLSIPVISAKSGYSINYQNRTRNVSVIIFYCIEKDSGLSLAIYKVVVLFAVPGLLMIICYTYVIRELWRSTRNMNFLTKAKSFRNSATLSTVVESGPPSCSNSMERNVNHKGGNAYHVSDKKMRITLQENKSSNSTNLLSVRQTTVGMIPKRQQNKGEDAKKARKQVIKMLILIIVLFLICWGPKLILSLTLKLTDYSFSSELYFTQLIFNLIPFIHSCINPIIYSFMSKNFRRSMQRLLHRFCTCLGFTCVDCRDPSSIPLRSTASARTRTTIKSNDFVNSSNYCHLSDAPTTRCTEVDCISAM